MPTPTLVMLATQGVTREDVANLLHPEQFRDWLRRLPGENPIAGWCASAKKCPLAAYLIEQGLDGVIVTDASVEWWDSPVGDYFDTISLPGWAQRFVRLVDSYAPSGVPPFSTDKVHRVAELLHASISAQECLRLLAAGEGLMHPEFGS